jgi:hypothetical protein
VAGMKCDPSESLKEVERIQLDQILQACERQLGRCRSE